MKLECRQVSPTPLHMRGDFFIFLSFLSLSPLRGAIGAPQLRQFRVGKLM